MPDINYRRDTQQRLQSVFTAEQAELLAEILVKTGQQPLTAPSKKSSADQLKIANWYIAILLLLVVSSLAAVGILLHELTYDRGFSGFDAVLLAESSMAAVLGCLVLAMLISRRKTLKKRIESPPEQSL